RAVVPADRGALARLEAVPEAVAVGAVVEQDRAGGVELVGERDAQLVRLLVGDRVEIRALALIPGRLGLGFAVGVGQDDAGGVGAEFGVDALEHRLGGAAAAPRAGGR